MHELNGHMGPTSIAAKRCRADGGCRTSHTCSTAASFASLPPAASSALAGGSGNSAIGATQFVGRRLGIGHARPVEFCGWWQFRKRFRDIPRLAQDLRETGRCAVGHGQQTEPGYRIRIVEIPLVFGNSDEIANSGIAGPGAAQCSARQVGRNAGLQKRADFGIGDNLFDRWQACRVKGLIWRVPGLGRRRCCFSRRDGLR